MSLFDDLVDINNGLHSTLQGINSLLPFEAETLKDTPPIIEVAIGSARQEGEETGYGIGYDLGFGNASSIIVNRSNEVIEKYTTPAEDWAALPHKIDEVYGVGTHDGKLSLLESSKYMRGSAEGELVTLRDVSPVRHNAGVEVVRKNWANLSNPINTYRAEVVSRTENTVTLKTTATGSKWSAVYYLLSEELVGKTLTISATWEASNASIGNAVRIQWINASKVVVGNMLGYIDGSGQTKTFTVTEKPADATDLAIILYAVADSTNAVAGDTVTFSNVQLEVGTTATPYTPYIEDTSAVKLQVRGKNWFNSSFTLGGLGGNNGMDWDGTDLQVRTDFIEVKPNQTYILSSGDYILLKKHCFDRNKNWLRQAVGKAQQIPTGEDTAYIRITCEKAGKTAFTAEDVEDINALPIQLELGTTATEYEPYTCTEYEQYEAISSISPNMTVTTDTDGALVSVEYLRDIDLYIDSLITGVALSGGE